MAGDLVAIHGRRGALQNLCGMDQHSAHRLSDDRALDGDPSASGHQHPTLNVGVLGRAPDLAHDLAGRLDDGLSGLSRR
jgi:hypothetical protein